MESFEKAKNNPERIKAIILIDPNNPTGFPMQKEILERITEIAEKNNSLILTDEVYAEFFSDNTSIVQIPEARKRTIRINALSKIERGTGIRVGDIYIAPRRANLSLQRSLSQIVLDSPKNTMMFVGFSFLPNQQGVRLLVFFSIFQEFLVHHKFWH